MNNLNRSSHHTLHEFPVPDQAVQLLSEETKGGESDAFHVSAAQIRQIWFSLYKMPVLALLRVRLHWNEFRRRNPSYFAGIDILWLDGFCCC